MKLIKRLLPILFTLSTPIIQASDNGVVVIVEAKAKPGNSEAVIAAFKGSQQQCQNWDGCRRFEITQSDQDNDMVILIEQWESKAKHRKEVQSVMAGESFPQFRQLLANDLQFQYLHLQ